MRGAMFRRAPSIDREIDETPLKLFQRGLKAISDHHHNNQLIF